MQKLIEEIEEYLGIELSPNCPMMHPDSPSTKLLRKCQAELERHLWIPVSERLPEPELERVLVAMPDGSQIIASYLDNSHKQFPWKGWRYEGMHPANIKFTHWMELPPTDTQGEE